jgi:hypothetical protein
MIGVDVAARKCSADNDGAGLARFAGADASAARPNCLLPISWQLAIIAARGEMLAAIFQLTDN